MVVRVRAPRAVRACFRCKQTMLSGRMRAVCSSSKTAVSPSRMRICRGAPGSDGTKKNSCTVATPRNNVPETHIEGSSLRALCSGVKQTQKGGGANDNVLWDRFAFKQ